MQPRVSHLHQAKFSMALSSLPISPRSDAIDFPCISASTICCCLPLVCSHLSTTLWSGAVYDETLGGSTLLHSVKLLILYTPSKLSRTYSRAKSYIARKVHLVKMIRDKGRVEDEGGLNSLRSNDPGRQGRRTPGARGGGGGPGGAPRRGGAG